MNKRDKHPEFPNVWIAALMLMLLWGVNLLISAFFYDLGLYSGPRDMVTAWSAYLIAAGLLISLLMGYRGLTYRDLFSPPPAPLQTAARMLPPLLLSSLGLSFSTGFVSNLMLQIYPPTETQLELFNQLLNNGAWSVIVVVFIGPVIEEITFRGLLLSSFLANYTPGRAIAYSALLFALYHLNIYQLPVAFAFGLFAGWLYYRTHSLWPSLIAHVIVNALAVGLSAAYRSDDALNTPAPFDSAAWAATAVVMLVVGLLWTNVTLHRIVEQPGG
jgi:membrane protease YdiL (CAAX protease family)